MGVQTTEIGPKVPWYRTQNGLEIDWNCLKLLNIAQREISLSSGVKFATKLGFKWDNTFRACRFLEITGHQYSSILAILGGIWAIRGVFSPNPAFMGPLISREISMTHPYFLAGFGQVSSIYTYIYVLCPLFITPGPMSAVYTPYVRWLHPLTKPYSGLLTVMAPRPNFGQGIRFWGS